MHKWKVDIHAERRPWNAIFSFRSIGALGSLCIDCNLNAYFTNCTVIRDVWIYVCTWTAFCRVNKGKNTIAVYFVCKPRYLITGGMLLRGISDLDVYVCPWRLYLEWRVIPTNSRGTRELTVVIFLKRGNKFTVCFVRKNNPIWIDKVGASNRCH